MDTIHAEPLDLSNDHNVYILGAGFSAFRGLPLISDFMHQIRDAHEFMVREDRTSEAEAISRVLRFRLDSAAAAYRVRIDLENIEELFSLASIVGDTFSADMRLAIAGTIDVAERTKKQPTIVLQRQRSNKIELPAHWTRTKFSNISEEHYEQFLAPYYEVLLAQLLGMLSGAKRVHTNTILTFNYDLLVDQALTRLGRPFTYGLSTGHESSVVSKGDLLHNNDAPLELLKLHGSMNWVKGPGEPSAMQLFSNYEEIRNRKLTPELVPPTWRKSITPVIQSIWSKAVDAIRRATRLVVIGFSIPPTDLHFKYLISAGLRNNLSLRNIVFLDLNPQAVQSRVEQLFFDLNRHPRVHVLEQRVEEIANQSVAASLLPYCGRPMHPSIVSTSLVR